MFGVLVGWGEHFVNLMHLRGIELYNDYLNQQKIDYIHMNPVKSGYVFRPEGYVYSSAGNYAGLKGVMEVECIILCFGVGRWWYERTLAPCRAWAEYWGRVIRADACTIELADARTIGYNGE